MRTALLTIWLGVASQTAMAQDPPALQARLADGSTLRFAVSDEPLVIVTKFGKLNVPLADLVAVDLAFRYPPGMEAKVAAAERDLGSADFRTRERAGKELLQLGEFAVPALLRAKDNPSPEVAMRAAALWATLEKQLPKTALEPRTVDRIETRDAVIVGKIETQSVTVKTAFFDKQPLQLATVREIRRPTAPRPN